MNGRSRPANRAAESSTAIKDEPIVTRAAVDALLGALPDGPPWPRWYLRPECDLAFAASILAHAPYVTPIYDEHDVLVAFAGIELKS